MATSINSYSVSFGMDASGYVDGANLSRRETTKLVRDIESARTPTEKFAREQDRLTDALNKGAISQETYNRLLDDKKNKLGLAEKSLISYEAGLMAASAAMTAVVGGGVAFVSYLKSVQNAIDDTVDSAGKLGVSYNELLGLRFAAQEGGGVDAGTVDASIKKLQISIAKAVAGDSGIQEAFGRLGLNAGELLKAGPVEAVLQIARSFEGVNSQAEKLQLSMQLFGKSGTELVSTLDGGADAIRESVDFQQRWNSLSEEQVAFVGANNDAWDRVKVAVEGTSNIVAAEFAPAMNLVADALLGSANEFQDIDGSVRFIVDNVVLLTGHMKDVFELANVINKTMYNTATLNFAGVAEGIGDALDVTSGASEALAALYDKREELASKAAKADEERKKKLSQLVLSDEETAGPSEKKSKTELSQKQPDSTAMADAVKQAFEVGSKLEIVSPSDEQLLKEMQTQVSIAQAQSSKMDQQIALLRELTTKQPEIVRAR